jgi:flagellar hook-basal body complex protein FliE
MDGLTINNTRQILDTGTTTKEINSVTQPIAPGPGGVEQTQKSFADTLKDAVGNVNAAQQESNKKMDELATGQTNNIHDVMISAEKADIALRLMVQVRNKMIEAYQEMMRMQV